MSGATGAAGAAGGIGGHLLSRRTPNPPDPTLLRRLLQSFGLSEKKSNEKQAGRFGDAMQGAKQRAGLFGRGVKDSFTSKYRPEAQGSRFYEAGKHAPVFIGGGAAGGAAAMLGSGRSDNAGTQAGGTRAGGRGMADILSDPQTLQYLLPLLGAGLGGVAGAAGGGTSSVLGALLGGGGGALAHHLINNRK